MISKIKIIYRDNDGVFLRETEFIYFIWLYTHYYADNLQIATPKL